MTLDEQCFWQSEQGLTGIFSLYLRNWEEGSQCPSWAVGCPVAEESTLCKYIVFVLDLTAGLLESVFTSQSETF